MGINPVKLIREGGVGGGFICDGLDATCFGGPGYSRRDPQLAAMLGLLDASLQDRPG